MKTFKPSEVIHEELMDILIYNTRYELMYSLGRFQEYYENPVLKGKVFTRLDLQDWQPDYYIQWSGCNFPPYVINELRDNPAWNLDRHEKDALSNMGNKYTIGVNREDEMEKVILHERAHALFSHSEEYRNLIHGFILKNLASTADAFKNLTEAGYHNDVLADEMQAYLISDTNRFDIDRDNEVYRPLYEEIVSKWSKELKL